MRLNEISRFNPIYPQRLFFIPQAHSSLSVRASLVHIAPHPLLFLLHAHAFQSILLYLIYLYLPFITFFFWASILSCRCINENYLYTHTYTRFFVVCVYKHIHFILPLKYKWLIKPSSLIYPVLRCCCCFSLIHI